MITTSACFNYLGYLSFSSMLLNHLSSLFFMYSFGSSFNILFLTLSHLGAFFVYNLLGTVLISFVFVAPICSSSRSGSIGLLALFSISSSHSLYPPSLVMNFSSINFFLPINNLFSLLIFYHSAFFSCECVPKEFKSRKIGENVWTSIKFDRPKTRLLFLKNNWNLQPGYFYAIIYFDVSYNIFLLFLITLMSIFTSDLLLNYFLIRKKLRCDSQQLMNDYTISVQLLSVKTTIQYTIWRVISLKVKKLNI